MSEFKFESSNDKNGFYGYSYLKGSLRIMKRIWAQFWNPWVMPVTWVCLDSATTQNSWRTSAQRTYLVFTFGRGLNFDMALYVSRMSICALRTSLCGANAMCCWLMWVSASYRKLWRNLYCDHRIFPVVLMLGVEPLLRVWLNYQPYRVVIQTWYLTRTWSQRNTQTFSELQLHLQLP